MQLGSACGADLAGTVLRSAALRAVDIYRILPIGAFMRYRSAVFFGSVILYRGDLLFGILNKLSESIEYQAEHIGSDRASYDHRPEHGMVERRNGFRFMGIIARNDLRFAYAET